MVDKRVQKDYNDNKEQWKKELDADTKAKYASVADIPGKVQLNLYDRIAMKRERGQW